jgi:hypothetical protein
MSRQQVPLLLLSRLLLQTLIAAPSSGSARAPIIKWLEDAGLVQQLLHFIALSPIAPAACDSSCSRLVDAVDSAPLPPVSLLELAHAPPQQVVIRRRLHH